MGVQPGQVAGGTARARGEGAARAGGGVTYDAQNWSLRKTRTFLFFEKYYLSYRVTSKQANFKGFPPFACPLKIGKQYYERTGSPRQHETCRFIYFILYALKNKLGLGIKLIPRLFG